jgi:hypothetical protein
MTPGGSNIENNLGLGHGRGLHEVLPLEERGLGGPLHDDLGWSRFGGRGRRTGRRCKRSDRDQKEPFHSDIYLTGLRFSCAATMAVAV